MNLRIQQALGVAGLAVLAGLVLLIPLTAPSAASREMSKVAEEIVNRALPAHPFDEEEREFIAGKVERWCESSYRHGGKAFSCKLRKGIGDAHFVAVCEGDVCGEHLLSVPVNHY